MKYKYVIGWEVLKECSGGQIALYSLCHLLNEVGEEAYMSGGDYPNCLGLNCPIMPSDLNVEDDNVIVVYPEVVIGNPLNAVNVVRYMLYPIGIIDGDINSHESTDLIIGWGEECTGGGYIINERNSVVIKYIMSDIYRNKKSPNREQSCYMVRKGPKWGQNLNQHPQGSIHVDGKTHLELAEIFNQCHTFYCYDPHTFYSTYASMCGCDSVVIPPKNLSKKDWKGSSEDTYGIAYGVSDIDRARESKPLMFEHLKNQASLNVQNTKKFINICINYFN